MFVEILLLTRRLRRCTAVEADDSRSIHLDDQNRNVLTTRLLRTRLLQKMRRRQCAMASEIRAAHGCISDPIVETHGILLLCFILSREARTGVDVESRRSIRDKEVR